MTKSLSGTNGSHVAEVVVVVPAHDATAETDIPRGTRRTLAFSLPDIRTPTPPLRRIEHRIDIFLAVQFFQFKQRQQFRDRRQPPVIIPGKSFSP
jgi:hypothetical protein